MGDVMSEACLTWCEVSEGALRANVRAFRGRLEAGVRLGVVVKADAYGHGLVLASRAFVRAGVDWLVCNALHEAEALRAAGIDAPIYLVGYVPAAAAEAAIRADVRLVVYDAEVVTALAAAGRAAGRVVPVHIKVETGNHRQGLELPEALALGRHVQALAEAGGGVRLEGISTHYADIEDTTDHRFALGQVARFEEAIRAFREAGLAVPVPNTANSAATILWPRTHAALVRVGISASGPRPRRSRRRWRCPRRAAGVAVSCRRWCLRSAGGRGSRRSRRCRPGLGSAMGARFGRRMRSAWRSFRSATTKGTTGACRTLATCSSMGSAHPCAGGCA
jgi:alanine racemase